LRCHKHLNFLLSQCTVAPAELESVLLTHPDIVDAAVIGVESREQATELPRCVACSFKKEIKCNPYPIREQRVCGPCATSGNRISRREDRFRAKRGQVDRAQGCQAQIVERR
jgi:acyl-CoA synthetase (AMP-forming)/AMP-acid ligase II